MTFAFFNSLLGFVIVLRIFLHLRERNLLTRDELTKIGTAYFLAVLIAIALLATQRSQAWRLQLWSAIFAPQAIIVVAVIARLRAREREFRTRFREVLTVVSLKMKSGRSFRQSLDEAINESDPRMRARLSEIRSVVVFSQQTRGSGDQFLGEVIDELSRVDRNPHAAIRRIGVFREKLRIEDDFRRKSGQVLAQIRAQSLIMFALYLALSAFVLHRFGWSDNRKAIAASNCLFIVGSLWIWFGGRRMKWKV